MLRKGPPRGRRPWATRQSDKPARAPRQTARNTAGRWKAAGLPPCEKTDRPELRALSDEPTVTHLGGFDASPDRIHKAARKARDTARRHARPVPRANFENDFWYKPGASKSMIG